MTADPNPTVAALHARIAGVLGPRWTAADCGSFPLRTLAAFVRGRDAQLDRDIAAVLESWTHVYGAPLAPRRARDGWSADDLARAHGPRHAPWTCAACETENDASVDDCEECGEPRGDA